MTTIIDLPPPGFSGGAADFARRGGQLRVSFGPRCQLGCWFCHNEGEIPPRITHHDRAIQPRRRVLTAADLLTSINAMTTAGIGRVFFTGGEPLLSPLARPVLEGMPAHQMSEYTTTLITNGLTLTKDLDWLATTALDRIKVSLHYFSDASIAAIAEGKPGDIVKIKAGIEAAIGVIPIVELNLLLQEQNAHEVADIIGYARELGTGLQIIELVGTDHNTGLGGAKIPSTDISNRLRTIATREEVVTSGTGQGRRVFTVPGRAGAMTIEVIDASLGRHHVGQCRTCSARSTCIEGFWALRLDTALPAPPRPAHGRHRAYRRPRRAAARGQRPPGRLHRRDARVTTTTSAPAWPAAYQPARTRRAGLFVVLEGISGSGKSTIAGLLAERLGCVHFHTVPAPVSDLQPYINSRAAAFPQLAFYLAGALHASDLARAALRDGHAVADRYINSVIANHAAVHGLDNTVVEATISPFTHSTNAFALTCQCLADLSA